MKPNINAIYLNKENEFIVPIHEKKRDYYKNSYWSYYQMNFISKKNGGNKRFLNQTKASMSFIPTRRMSLWWPNMKGK